MPNTKSQNYHRFFANVFTIISGDNDISVTFSYGGEGHPDGVVDEGTLIMTPRSVKMLAAVLASAVEQYEEEFGHIDIPEGRLADIRTPTEL